MELELKTILDPAIIDLAVAGRTKDEVLRRMAEGLRDNGYVDDVERFVQDIYEREAKGPTGMGSGVSIPHGRSPAAKRMGIAIGRTVEPIRWESGVSGDGWQETRLVFLFCVRADAAFAENHLTLLSQLAGKLGSEARLVRLGQCRSVDEIIAVLLMGDGELGEAETGEAAADLEIDFRTGP